MRRTTHLSLFILIAILAAGCGYDPADPGLDLQADGAAKVLNHYALLESLDYESVHGTITPGVGGSVIGHLSTWPQGGRYGLIVPADALETEDPTPVLFEVRVPTYDSYMAHAGEHLPLILRCEPDGIQFKAPVTLLGTYMPWEKGEPEASWQVVPVWDDGKVVGVTYEEIGPVEVQPVMGHVEASFEVMHFSDWETGQLPD